MTLPYPSQITNQPARRLLLLAWLLWVVQVPYHGGMQAAAELPGNYGVLDPSSLGINCGPRPDAATVAKLVKAGFIDAADVPVDHSGLYAKTLCDLFASLLAPAAYALAPEIHDRPTSIQLAASVYRFVSSRPILPPPARGPPYVS